MDSGTGHAANFAACLLRLSRLGLANEGDCQALVARVFVKYLDLMRMLQTTHWLEPAGTYRQCEFNLKFNASRDNEGMHSSPPCKPSLKCFSRFAPLCRKFLFWESWIVVEGGSSCRDQLML